MTLLHYLRPSSYNKKAICQFQLTDSHDRVTLIMLISQYLQGGTVREY